MKVIKKLRAENYVFIFSLSGLSLHSEANLLPLHQVLICGTHVFHKLFGDLQSLPVPAHCWKDLLMDFEIRLPILTD